MQPLFASTELVARVERAEVALISGSAAGVARSRPQDDVLQMPISGGIASYAAPGSPLNKLVGLGFGGRVTDAALAAVEEEFARRGAAVQAEVATLADPEVFSTLARRGYVLRGFENVLGRPLSDRESFPPPGPIEVVRGEPQDLATWLDVLVTGFAHPDGQGVVSHESYPRDVLERDIQVMTGVAGFQRWLARRDGALAGAASMRLGEGVAQLCGAATLPAHRRRGVQAALLHERLKCAARSGCDLAIVTTQPGSKSAQNAQRQGFQLLYARAVMVLPESPA